MSNLRTIAVVQNVFEIQTEKFFGVFVSNSYRPVNRNIKLKISTRRIECHKQILNRFTKSNFLVSPCKWRKCKWFVGTDKIVDGTFYRNKRTPRILISRRIDIKSKNNRGRANCLEIQTEKCIVFSTSVLKVMFIFRLSLSSCSLYIFCLLRIRAYSCRRSYCRQSKNDPYPS